MTPLPRPLIAIARDRSGVLTAQDLDEHRIAGRARQQLFDTGQLVRMHRGVYRLSSHAESFTIRCRAVCLSVTDAAIAGPSAGRLWGLRKVHTDEVHVLSRRAIRLDGVTAHRTDLLGPDDAVVRDSIRLLRPARLLCDLAGHLDDFALESVLEQMLERRMLSIQSARAAAKRFVAPGRPGSLRLGRVLDARPDWLKPTESDLELRMWRALSGRGLEVERQYPVVLDSGRKVRLDLAIPAIMLAIEVDHATWHGGRLDAQRDKRRDRELTRLGWTSTRVTDADIEERYEATVRDVLAIVARCAAVARS
jgi:very-short-patch-repair endonuclease